MLFRATILLCLILGLSACQKSSETSSFPSPGKHKAELIVDKSPVVPLSAPSFLSQPIPAESVETIADALPLWRRYAKNRPWLVVVSQSPGLVPIPEENQKEAHQLLLSADDATLRLKSGPVDSDPVLLPQMSIGAALDAGWLRGLVWIFPTSLTPDKVDAATFKSQLSESGLLSAEESETLNFSNGVFQGIVHGRPFIAAPALSAPKIDGPVLLHIDSDYFKKIYKGEIKTPLYPLLFDTLTQLKNAGWLVAEATVSRSNYGEIPLASRFLGKDIVEILTEPEMFAQEMPGTWRERANALYLENFMQKDKMREIYLAIEKEEPTDPSIKYALYQLARQFNKGNEALHYLDQAVKIDPIYAAEYLALADLAQQKQKPQNAVEMIELARAALPNDPAVQLQSARIFVNAGENEKAKKVLTELRQIQWSDIYYPDQKESVEGLESLLSN